MGRRVAPPEAEAGTQPTSGLGNVLTARSFALFAAIGGWRTVAEAIGSRALFLVAYLTTGELRFALIVAVAGVAALAAVRVRTDRQWRHAGLALAVVGASALISGSTGRAADFYITDIVRTMVAGVVMLTSMLIRWPLVGVVAGVVRRDGFRWRRDRARRRRYQLCTAVFLAKLVVMAALMVPFYRSDNVVALGVVASGLNLPMLALCAFVCWRLLEADRSPLVPAPVR